LIAVLILSSASHHYDPLLQSDESLSFLPLTVNTSLLSAVYSSINSYFSRDKIFVVCRQNEVARVSRSCQGLEEENILVEPDRGEYLISVYYASVILSRIMPDETCFFYPVSYLYSAQAKLAAWLYPVMELSEKGWITLVTELSDCLQEGVPVIEAGKIMTSHKGIDFFSTQDISRKEIRRKKLFGKTGRFGGAMVSQLKPLIEWLDSDQSSGSFYQRFQKENPDWSRLTELYREYLVNKKIDLSVGALTNLLTIFTDSRSFFFDNWENFIYKSSESFSQNVISGKVEYTDCQRSVVFNFDPDTQISVEGLIDTVVVKKDGNVSVKRIQ
jgi:mannose-1-phosphate guanylyltransferase